MEKEVKNFKVYKSSAGSGKTTTLVTEYLCLALPRPADFHRILAITFTVKATNEMKSRVINTLEKIVAGNKESDIVAVLTFQRLKKEYGFSEDEFKRKAEMLLHNILHSYSSFAMSTIDSFVVKIVKAFAFDLHLPLNFDIELDSELLIEEAVSALISRAGYDQKLTDFLLRYIIYQADEERDTRLEIQLSNLAGKVLFNDSFFDFRKALDKTSERELFVFSEKVIKRYGQLSSKLKELGNKALSLIENKGLNEKDFYRGASGLPKYFSYIAALNVDKMMPNSYVLTTVNEDKWFSGKNNDIGKQNAIMEIRHELLSIFKKIQSNVENFITIYFLRRNLEALVILGSINDELRNYYKENSVIHLSEAANKVAEVVAKEEMPFIYERIGTKYNHYLIDEFQDTSVLQWKNLLPLIENSLAEGHFNLIVGDGKQSIYRWRGGDFEQFTKLPLLKNPSKDRQLLMREQTLKRNFAEVVLETNYRSSKAVVNFNNALFDFIKQNGNPVISEVFTKHEQKTAREKEGYVELSFLPSRKDDEQKMKKKITSIIKDLLSRDYGLGDICILSRKNISLEYVSEVLLEAGIPIVSGQSLRLDASADINFIINLIRWVLNNDDQIAQTAVFFYLKSHINAGQSLASLKSPEEMLLYLNAGENIVTNISSSSDAASIIESAAKFFGIYKRAYAYIIRLLEFAKEAERVYGRGLVSFIDYCDRYLSKQHILMPENAQAVKLMTIHSSKGLEFPAVIFVDFATKGKGDKYLTVKLDKAGFDKPEYSLIENNKNLENSAFGDDKSQADNLRETDETNVLYVAVTRAADELFIVVEDKAPYDKKLKEFVGKTEIMQAAKEDGSEKRYISGVKENSEIKGRQKQGLFLDNTAFKPWNERLSLRRTMKTAYFGNDREEALSEGLKVHSLFARIKSKNDVEPLLSKALQTGEIAGEELEKYRALINEVMEHPDLSQYFDEGIEVMNERSIITGRGEKYRPDSIRIKGNDISVLDYKYSEELSDRYLPQMQNYLHLLQEIYPSKNINGKIVWLKGGVRVSSVSV